MVMHKNISYQTRLTEGQWSCIDKVFFENDCRHRKYSLRSIFEAVLYLLVTGCQWRMLPHDFPRWEAVYWHFRKWRESGRIQHCIEKLAMRIRRMRGQSLTPSVMALDAQSVKWGNRRSSNGFDANKKVKGVKHNIAVDRNGFILGRLDRSAAIHDSRLARPICRQVDDAWPIVRKGLLDRGYRGKLVEEIRCELGMDIEVCSTPNGTNGFTPKPLRWVVERTFAWLDSFRRLGRNYEQTDESAEEMIDFATIKLLIAHV